MSANIFDHSILPDFIIVVDLFVQSHKLWKSNYVILTSFLLFPTTILTSLFSKPPFMISLHDEKPIIYHMISTATAYWHMREINTVKDVKNYEKDKQMHFCFMNATFNT